jgi:pimeloyl-ACP methyl ester carboxylesterase/DNA-binding CsgD family transcriptional regulator
MKGRYPQRIRYLRTSDGVQLAWAEAGCGPLLIATGNWLAHLEHDLESPVWRHWIQFFSEHFRFVRYDERGCGMTDWNIANLSLERWVEDLEAVVAAVDPQEPFPLFGISHGAAICAAYAARHPERVSRLILYGGFALGWAHRGDPLGLRKYEAIVELVRSEWANENPAFRQVFTSRFIPGANENQIAWFNNHCRRTTSAANAAALMVARAEVNVSDLLSKIEAPTLVLHARDDGTVPVTQGHLLAAGIPNAEFFELDSNNHILLEHEPAWGRFCEAVLDFMNLETRATPQDAAFAELSPRERQVLTLLTEGLGNAAIAERLSISDKTVRNHMSNLFDKLGVWTRAQAIVFARDHRFSARDNR